MISGSKFGGLIVVLFVLQLVVPGPGKNQEVFASPVVSESNRNDLSPPLLSITPRVPMVYEGDHQRDYSFERPSYRRVLPGRKAPSTDLRLQDWEGAGQMPGPILSFPGISASEVLAGNGYTPYPPDPNGDVGLDHYVQWVNVSFAVWDKTGKRVYGPAAGNALWSGFGGPCESTNDGDPVALFDRIANRWVMSQFAFPNIDSGQGPFYQCIAVSQTSDPTAGWYRYEFKISGTKLNDYPKLGVWPDAYYMSINQFQYDPNTNDFTTWGGAGAVAFERSQMLQGLPARLIYVDLNGVDPNLGNMLPSHLNGPNLPPLGSPNYFVQFDDNSWGFPQDQLEVWRFSADWVNPASSSFTHLANLATEPFDSSMCRYSMNCIPQPMTMKKLDALSDRLMYRLQYRNFGNHETMVVNHTVDVNRSDHAGIRWYELRDTGSGWSIRQQGTYAPDANHRWMGSLAMDGSGNMVLGYSVSGKKTYPSIRYTGRLADDPLNVLPQTETSLVEGKGMQSKSSRWGDYSTLSVDPVDDCTFWYTQEYYDKEYRKGWKTRIGTLRFPSCVPSKD
jgi:hypothetical protein